MGRRLFDVRRSHREGRPFRNNRYRAKDGDFTSQLIGGCIVAAMLGWFAAAPRMGAVGTAAQSAPASNTDHDLPVYYPNCNAARAAGAAPIYEGQPGYRPEMDGDSDGIACEPPRW
jgi:hypothetical protein